MMRSVLDVLPLTFVGRKKKRDAAKLLDGDGEDDSISLSSDDSQFEKIAEDEKKDEPENESVLVRAYNSSTERVKSMFFLSRGEIQTAVLVVVALLLVGTQLPHA